jgi:hypothetical protein
MRTRFLPRHAWAHPYGRGPLAAAVFYADGGDGGQGGAGDGRASGTGDGGKTDDAKPGTGGTGADGEGDGDGDDKTDWKAEAEKHKALSRKHEDRAKANATAAKELAELKKQGMSDSEKAVAEAAEEARGQERVRLGGKLARAGFLAAAAGRLPDAAAVADDLNLSKYVADDGEVDEKGLAELVNRVAPKDGAGAGGGKQRGFDQGARGTGRTEQRTSSVAAGRDLWADRQKKTT